jgi:WD40 repeat protein
MLLICTSPVDLSNIFHVVLFKTFAGSVDKTVKFWDLETFELIGSSGPEVPYLFITTHKINCSYPQLKLFYVQNLN